MNTNQFRLLGLLALTLACLVATDRVQAAALNSDSSSVETDGSSAISNESDQSSAQISDESASSASESSESDETDVYAPLEAALVCNPLLCQPPNCRCAATSLDEGRTPAEQIPQLVMLTFDDAVTALNYEYVQRAIDGRVNPDGCPAAATFFVSHEYTDYSKVHALWAAGHEIALHSITHNHMSEHWKSIDVDGLVAEFGEQLEIMEHFGRVDRSEIRGMRLPLFQLSGNNSFEAIRRLGLEYDSSWPSQHYITPGMWPYSLDYRSIQDCPIGQCPNAALSDVWVNPILDWVDTQGFMCSMVDACGHMPEDNVEDIVQWMITNFERNYKNNRAPFGVYLHAAWFEKGVHYFEAYMNFLDYLEDLPDVYFVSSHRALEFARNPRAGQPFDECQKLRKPTCVPKMCQLRKESTGQERWMTSCAKCPTVYPWLGNPYGYGK